MNSVPSSIRIARWPLTWYWKCGASQLSVLAIGFTSFDQRQPGCEDEAADLAAADLQDLRPAVRELARLVGCLEALVLGLLHRCCMALRSSWPWLTRDSNLLVGRVSDADPGMGGLRDGDAAERRTMATPRRASSTVAERAGAGARLQRLQLRRRRRGARRSRRRACTTTSPARPSSGEALIDALRDALRRGARRHRRSDGRRRPRSSRAYARLYADVLRGKRMCLCGMLAAEYQTLPEPMRDAVLALLRRERGWSTRVLEQGRDEGTLRVRRRAARGGAA